MNRRVPIAAILLGVLLEFTSAAAMADDSAQKYGVGDITVTASEKQADLQYGGFPNSKEWNNDTPCGDVVALFDTPEISPANPKMLGFLRYARVKLMEVDIAWSLIKHLPPGIDLIGTKRWRALPSFYPTYCKENPGDNLEAATDGVYETARLVAMFAK